MSSNDYERRPVYITDAGLDPRLKFLDQWRNYNFRCSKLTYLTLLFLLIIYPAATLFFTGDPATIFENLNQGTRLVLMVSTILMQWSVFLLIYLTVYREQTGLAGLGFKRLRMLDFAWAGAFLLVAFAVMAGLTWSLTQIGLPMPGEISLLIPTDLPGRFVWVAVAATAGICEETAFRGYLMTRLRIMSNFRSWIIPTAVSAVVFGLCHYSYQGLAGLIVISIYGLMLSLLYIRTQSIWPVIIAHFFQDFLALFVPQ